MSHLAEIYRLFPRRITAVFVIPIYNSVGVFFTKCKLSHELGIYTGTSRCIVKLPDEVCVTSHETRRRKKSSLNVAH